MKKKRAPRPAKLGVIELPSRLTIAQSVELHRTLAKALGTGGPLCFDGSKVEEIDTAILQLLSSAWASASRCGVACKWQGTSATLRNSAMLIGVSEILKFA